MTTNADRQTPYEYETTNALIAEVRRLRADNIAPQSSRNRLVALTEQLADALEASIEAEHDAERRFAAMLEVEASLRKSLEASEAQVAKVREQAIWRAAYEHADEYQCRLCRTSWIMGRETEHHADGCSAAPVGAAPMEDATP